MVDNISYKSSTVRDQKYQFSVWIQYLKKNAVFEFVCRFCFDLRCLSSGSFQWNLSRSVFESRLHFSQLEWCKWIHQPCDIINVYPNRFAFKYLGIWYLQSHTAMFLTADIKCSYLNITSVDNDTLIATKNYISLM